MVHGRIIDYRFEKPTNLGVPKRQGFVKTLQVKINGHIYERRQFIPPKESKARHKASVERKDVNFVVVAGYKSPNEYAQAVRGYVHQATQKPVPLYQIVIQSNVNVAFVNEVFYCKI